MAHRTYHPGDPVIFTKPKLGSRPGPRARRVHPFPRGEGFVYVVDKLWVVAEAHSDGTLLLQTRTGKRHLVRAGDEKLRRPSLWERLRYRHRFPRLETPAT